MNIDIFDNFYRGKRVLITGHTGFKGSWLAIWLHELGAEVIGLALDPFSDRDNYVLSGIQDKIIDLRGDIRDGQLVKDVFQKYQPEIVFHLAAQPLVRLSYDIPVETYEVNVMGSIHVMEAIRETDSVKVVVMITTDKCYENREQIWGYRENEAMGGYDPYSSSKGAAEIAIASWRRSFFHTDKHAMHGKSIASVRAGNVIGGGDWALDRIIPDCIKALEADSTIDIRSPKAIRPWQHVLEPLSGYMLLAQKMWNEPTKYCEGWNFGPHAESIATVWDVATKVVENYYTTPRPKGCPESVNENSRNSESNFPSEPVRPSTEVSGHLRDLSVPLQGVGVLHEAKLLMLDISKAKFNLGWVPKLNIEQTVALTIDWYKQYRDISNVYELCTEQINKYLNS